MGPEVAAATTAAGTAGTAGTAAWLTPEVAGALLAGGTAAQMLASREQARAQRRILNRAQDENDRTVKEGADDTLKLAGGMAPATQAEKIQAAAQAAAGRTMGDLRGAGADMIDTAGGAGATSSNFGRLRAERQAAEADRLAAIAQEVGRVRAPAEVMGNEAMARSALAERLASSFRVNQGRAQAAQLDAQDVDRPWYGDVGQIAALVGGIGLANPSAASASGTPATQVMAVPEGMTAQQAAMWEANAGALQPGAGFTAAPQQGYWSKLTRAIAGMPKRRRHDPYDWDGR